MSFVGQGGLGPRLCIVNKQILKSLLHNTVKFICHSPKVSVCQKSSWVALLQVGILESRLFCAVTQPPVASRRWGYERIHGEGTQGL